MQAKMNASLLSLWKMLPGISQPNTPATIEGTRMVSTILEKGISSLVIGLRMSAVL